MPAKAILHFVSLLILHLGFVMKKTRASDFCLIIYPFSEIIVFLLIFLISVATLTYMNLSKHNRQQRFAKKSSAKHIGSFALLFLANLCNNLSYILYRKLPICFALPFLANLCNYLSYILYKHFPIYFALPFLAN